MEYTTDKGFDVVPLFMSDSTCWNELENTEIVDQEVVFNPDAGEVQKSYPLALALSRKMGEREQKIIILGDADCLSDGELTRNRNPLWAANYVIIQGSFFWLSDGEVPIDVRLRMQLTGNYLWERRGRRFLIMLCLVFSLAYYFSWLCLFG